MPASPMKMRGRRATTASDVKRAASADTTRARPDLITIGPLGPVYVPPPGQPGPAGLLWRAVARAARRAGTRVAHRVPLTNRRAGPASRPARQAR
jgi:hypothetical protein